MSQPAAGSIAVVAVNYDTDSHAIQFVKEVTELTKGIPVRIVLVDNSERVDSTELFDRILSENPAVLCLKPPTNLGYFRGASYGLQQCVSSGQNHDWLMVANVDVSFLDREFFAKLRAIQQDRDVGVVAPSIRSATTLQDQNPMMLYRPTSSRMRFYQLLHRSYYLLSVYELLSGMYHMARSAFQYILRWRPAHRARSDEHEILHGTLPRGAIRVPIYAPHGACMIFSNAFFARGGSLDVPFFLYGEEIYVAETARALGLQVMYDPCLRLQHNEHQSTGRSSLLLSRQAAKYLRETTDYLVDAYFS